jgi:hypothetical protein
MRRHGLDPLSLVFGAILTAVGALFLFTDVDISRVPPAWSWPIPLMLAGALIIVLAARRGRSDDQAATKIIKPTDDPAADATAAETDAQ